MLNNLLPVMWSVAAIIALQLPSFAAEPRPGDEAIEKYLAGETRLLGQGVLANERLRQLAVR